jgi:single-stranded-DNA-specific exonuclease
VVGLVAGRLADEWGRPVVLIERGETSSRGSARSIPGFNMVAALDQCADLLVRFGGHAQAAGFTVGNEQLPVLARRLLTHAEAVLPAAALGATLQLDAELPIRQLTWGLLDELAQLEPFGQENARPVLLSRGVRVHGAWSKGADGRTLKLRLGDAEGPVIDAVGFRMGELVNQLAGGQHIDVVYRLEVNEWNGERCLQLRLLDLRPA